MGSSEIFSKILNSFKRYYSIKLPDSDKGIEVTAPFSAEAEFISRTEQYFLVKAAKLSEMNSNEYVFFYNSENLNNETLLKIENIAWETGISRVNPTLNHKNTDVALIIVCDAIEEDAFNQIKKINHYKSYCFTFKGWSRFRIIALETNTKKITYNRFGENFKKTIEAINL